MLSTITLILLLAEDPVRINAPAPVFDVAFSPNGDVAIATGGNGEGRVLWCAQSGADKTKGRILRHEGPVTAAVFFASGNRLATGSFDGSVHVWNVSGRRMHTLQHRAPVRGVDVSADGSLIASAGGSEIRLWRSRDGAVVKKIKAEGARAVAFSPKGDLLAIVSADHHIELVRMRSWQLARTLRGHKGPIQDVRFSPDGRLLASAGVETPIRIWSVQDGRLLRTFHGHGSIAISPNGQLLAAVDSSSVRIWTLQTGAEVKSLSGHTSIIESVAFSEDGALIATGSLDSTCRIWKLKPSLGLNE